jgi:hypothetical protein
MNSSLYSNITFLSNLNFCQNSFGLLKCTFPQLSITISYHQLSLYKAAHSFYGEVLTKGDSSYFYALNEFRSVFLNLTLSISTDIYDHVLYKTRENNDFITVITPKPYSGSIFTTFLTHVNLTFILRFSLSNELYNSLKILQHRGKLYSLTENS